MTTTTEETKAPQTTEEPEIDFDRIKDGDEAYTAEVNQRLAARQVAEETAPKGAPEGEQQAQEPAQPAQPNAAQAVSEEFVTFDDGDPIYKGQPFKVSKSELKSLVQKGRHLETRLSELNPYINLVRSNPALAEAFNKAVQDPTVAAELNRIAANLQTGRITQAQAEDDLSDLQIEGLHPDDVRNVAKVQKALLEREGKKRQEQEERSLRQQLEYQNQRATAMVHGLRELEGDAFEQVRPVMQRRIGELRAAVEHGAISEQDFNQFIVGLTDPTATDDRGTPLFIRFYRDTKAELAQAGTSTPAAAAMPKPAPTNNSRLAPGTTSARGGSGSEPDWLNMSQAEFDRRINEKLAKL